MVAVPVPFLTMPVGPVKPKPPPFEGGLAHATLCMLLTRRLDRLGEVLDVVGRVAKPMIDRALDSLVQRFRNPAWEFAQDPDKKADQARQNIASAHGGTITLDEQSIGHLPIHRRLRSFFRARTLVFAKSLRKGDDAGTGLGWVG